MGIYQKGHFSKNEIENEKDINEHQLKEELVFTLLKKNNIDLNTFISSHFYSHNRYVLIEHIYGLLKGYDYSYKSVRENTPWMAVRIVPVKTPNNCVMELDSIKIEFMNDTLTISDENISYNYFVDEHCIIYLNGKDLNIAQKILTEDEYKKSCQELYDRLNRDYHKNIDNHIKSDEFSKHYHVK